MSICTDQTGDPWNGEAHACTLPAAHVFDVETHWHRCSCAAMWVDDQQVDEARRGAGVFA